jgi:hypothetical protein
MELARIRRRLFMLALTIALAGTAVIILAGCGHNY